MLSCYCVGVLVCWLFVRHCMRELSCWCGSVLVWLYSVCDGKGEQLCVSVSGFQWVIVLDRMGVVLSLWHCVVVN